MEKVNFLMQRDLGLINNKEPTIQNKGGDKCFKEESNRKKKNYNQL